MDHYFSIDTNRTFFAHTTAQQQAPIRTHTTDSDGTKRHGGVLSSSLDRLAVVQSAVEAEQPQRCRWPMYLQHGPYK